MGAASRRAALRARHPATQAERRMYAARRAGKGQALRNPGSLQRLTRPNASPCFHVGMAGAFATA
jgi:hypothetical protein